MKKAKNHALALLFLAPLLVSGQNYLMHYMFSPVNQNLMVSPAQKHNYKFVLGIPILSTVGVSYNNTLLTPGDFLNDNTLSQNLNQIIPNMSYAENIHVYQNIDLLFVGFQARKGYVSFGVQQDLSASLTLPGDLFKFLYFGNANVSSFTLAKDNFDIDVYSGVNYHLGYQRSLLKDKLIIGGRVKMIAGLANAQFSKMNASLQTDIFDWTAETDILIESSLPVDIENPQLSLAEALSMIGRANPGWAVDLGGTYTLEKWLISASVLNFGQVTFKENVQRYQSQGSFSFEGFNYDFESGDVNFNEILDSLSSAFNIKQLDDASPYTIALPMHILISGQYNITPKHAFNATYQGTYRQEKYFNNFGINYIGSFHKRFQLIASSGMLYGGQLVFGAGMSAALGPLQFYVLSDNLSSIRIEDLAVVHFRFGLNMVFYKKTPEQIAEKTNKKVNKQKPSNIQENEKP